MTARTSRHSFDSAITANGSSTQFPCDIISAHVPLHTTVGHHKSNILKAKDFKQSWLPISGEAIELLVRKGGTSSTGRRGVANFSRCVSQAQQLRSILIWFLRSGSNDASTAFVFHREFASHVHKTELLWVTRYFVNSFTTLPKTNAI